MDRAVAADAQRVGEEEDDEGPRPPRPDLKVVEHHGHAEEVGCHRRPGQLHGAGDGLATVVDGGVLGDGLLVAELAGDEALREAPLRQLVVRDPEVEGDGDPHAMNSDAKDARDGAQDEHRVDALTDP